MVTKGEAGAPHPTGDGADGQVRFPDMDWFFSNLDQLTADHPNEWVAIVGERVVASASTAAQLREDLRRKGIERPFISRTPPASEPTSP